MAPHTFDSSRPVLNVNLSLSEQTKLLSKVGKLGLSGPECVGLWLGLFNIFDESAAIPEVTRGIACASAGGDGVEWVCVGEGKKKVLELPTQSATSSQ